MYRWSICSRARIVRRAQMRSCTPSRSSAYATIMLQRMLTMRTRVIFASRRSLGQNAQANDLAGRRIVADPRIAAGLVQQLLKLHGVQREHRVGVHVVARDGRDHAVAQY